MFFFLFLFLAGIAGVICFALTIHLAYLSLAKKLQARETKKTVTIDVPSIVVSPPTAKVEKSIGVINAFNSSNDNKTRNRAMTLDSLTQEVNLLKRKKNFFIYI